MIRSFLELFRLHSDLSDTERIRRSTRLFSAIGLGLSFSLYLVGRILVPEDEIVGAALLITIIIAAGFVLSLLGITQLARALSPLSVLVAVFYLMWTGQGLHDIALSGFGITLVFAGLMLGRRGPLAFSILAVIGVALVSFAENSGILSKDLSSGVFEVSAIAVTTLGAGIFLYFMLGQFEQSLTRSRQNEQAQFVANQELRALRDTLELRIGERTASLERRSSELEAAAQVAREAATAQDPNTMLNDAVRLISQRFNYYHAGIFLLDGQREYAILSAASSDGGLNMLARNHRLRVGSQGMVGVVAATRQPRIALDVGSDAAFFNNPDLPHTRSEMALPLTGREGVIGVLDIQSTEPEAFTQDDLEIMQILADLLASAIQNTRLLTESRNLIEQLEALTARESRRGWRERVGTKGLRATFTAAGVTIDDTPKKDRAQTARLTARHRTDIPILIRGQRIGRISMFRDENEPNWSEDDRNTAAEIARQIGLALENARLTDEARQRAQREQMISSVSARVRETLDLDTILQTASREMVQALGLKEVEIRLGKPEKAGKK